MYLWHWPVIALAAALAGSGPTSAWVWVIETGVTIALAAASWRFIETPILRNGLHATIRHWRQRLSEVRTRPADVPSGPADVRTRSAWRRPGSVPVAVAAVTVLTVVVAVVGVVRPAESATPAGLLRQVAAGQRISSASQSARPPAATATTATTACRRGKPPAVSGDQVTAVGDSILVASATALAAAMPGIYISAQVGRQMQSGLAVIQGLAAARTLRHVVIVSLGTNGDVTARQLGRLRQLIGPNRDLVLVNTFGPMPWEHEVNAALAAAAGRGGHTELANWNHAIAADPSLLWPDGIHPQPSGAKLYARVILAAVRAALSRAQPSSCPRPKAH
jgi:hypothetical protein